MARDDLESRPDELTSMSIGVVGGDSIDRKRVLVVDDDDDVREGLQLALEANGYRADAVADGRAALVWLGRNPPPRLILLDLMMPVMDGWQVLDALDADARLSSIPVVIVTAFRGDRLGKAATRALLRKPIELDELMSAIAANDRGESATVITEGAR
jgi:CheY-like chemotaxis protein